MSIRTRSIAIAAVSAVALAGAASPALAQRTITVTTPQSAPMAFKGMPKTLKAGTYTFRYVNSSGFEHNLKVGSKATPLFSTGSKTVKVTLKKGTTVAYECTPHKTMMKGTIKVT
jgi:plastocyanin